MYQAPDSDIPSTPNSRLDNFPSTTPAGPPPSDYTHNSFTPAGPPPSLAFGSSQFNSGKEKSGRPTFSTSGRLASNLFTQSHNTNNGESLFGNTQGNAFGLLGSSPPKRGYGYTDEDEEPEDLEQDAEGEEDDDMTGHHDDMDEENSEIPQWNIGAGKAFATSTGSLFDSQNLQSSRLRDSRSAGLFQGMETRPQTHQDKFDLTELAKSKSVKNIQSQIQEPDGLIISQEESMQDLHRILTRGDESEATLKLHSLAVDLPGVWWNNAQAQPQNQSKEDAQARKSLRKATILASLLLQIHHPPLLQHDHTSLFAKSLASSQSRFQPIPKVLLDWLNTYHNTFVSDVDTVLGLKRNYSGSSQFWDAIMASCLRGRFEDTITLLRDANFAVAISATADGGRTPGYRGTELDSVEKVVNDMIIAIEGCPAIKYSDWDVKGERWKIYRRLVAQAMGTLREYAEGGSYDRSASKASLSASISGASRRAESKVPWTVYDNLMLVYEHLLGNPDELIGTSADWIEAVIALTVWWDGEDEEDNALSSLAASRLSMSRSLRGRKIDIDPTVAYRRRLAASLVRVLGMEDEELQFNEASTLQIGLGCIFEDNLDGAFTLLRSLSLAVSVAVEEIASTGKWGHNASREIMKGFDKSDLMVLSYLKSQQGSLGGEATKDEQLIAYAEKLADKDVFVSESGDSTKEGWQLAVQVLGRLDSDESASNAISKLLDDLELDSTERVDKVVLQLTQMGFKKQSESISERYADTLAATTYDYGPTLVYYARAHQTQKLHSILDLLISFSLVHSLAYPPPFELDPQLEALLLNPRHSLGALSQIDPVAAELLATSLSGYATVRSFYDLRDQEIQAAARGAKPSDRPLARQRNAANALVALISSASSSIAGGLYDPDAEAVIQVDGLAVLLGEVLPLLRMEPCPISMRHLNTLLAAIEDLVSSPGLIHDQCAECLRAALAAANGEGVTDSPRDLLKKSVSALSERTTGTTASSQFSLVGSSLLSKKGGSSAESSMVMDRERAWDWRTGFKSDVSLDEIIGLLRVEVAGLVAKRWIEGDGFQV